jgi:hypothetical protein
MFILNTEGVVEWWFETPLDEARLITGKYGFKRYFKVEALVHFQNCLPSLPKWTFRSTNSDLLLAKGTCPRILLRPCKERVPPSIYGDDPGA